MHKYIFILGQSADLASQELVSFLSEEDKLEKLSNNFAIVSTKKESTEIIKNLGGTIKIAKYIESITDINELNEEKWLEYLNPQLSSENKNYFGFSLYNNKSKYKDVSKMAMGLKKTIKSKGLKVRLVTSKEPILSSVIVAKNKLIGKELVIIFDDNQIHLGLTSNVQDFEFYNKRDAMRPGTDAISGMLPPKVAQMMINLSQAKKNSKLLDPFCGSGTILQEAALMGVKKIYGSDKSQVAIDDSQKNINWLRKEHKIKSEILIKKADSRHLQQTFETDIDCIVSEPYMGNARLIQKTRDKNTLEQIKKELQNLYSETFRQFYKVLSINGRVVFVFPIFQNDKDRIYTLDAEEINKIGFKQIKPDIQSNQLSTNGNIIYMRPGQKVLREITIWKK